MEKHIKMSESEELLTISLTQNDKLKILSQMCSIHSNRLAMNEQNLKADKLLLSLLNDEILYLNEELLYFLSLNPNSEEIQSRIKELQSKIEETQGMIKETEGRVQELQGEIKGLQGIIEDIGLRIKFNNINVINREDICFGDVNIGSSEQEVLTITNTDDTSPLVIEVDVYGDGFKIINNENSITIQPGESKDLNIQFSPTATSNYTGSVLIKFYEYGLVKYTITVPLTGNGLGIISVDDPAKLPIKYSLLQNYLNPFNSTTTIQYTIPKDEYVKLVMYDITGKVVKELVNGYRVAGKYNLEFNASGYTSGVYYYKIEAGAYKSVQKMMPIK